MERRCIRNSQSIAFVLKCTLSKSIHLFTYLSILRWLPLPKITSTLSQIWQLIMKNIYFCFIDYAKAFDQRRQWQATPVLLPRKSHGQSSLVDCSPWGLYESDTTERLHFHFSLSYIGEGNGNSLQCSCLENPRDGGAWWAAVYGVAQSRTQLKRLSSSSSSSKAFDCVDHNKLEKFLKRWEYQTI